MKEAFRLFPEAASSLASQVDALYFFLLAVSIFFSVLIFFLVFYFAIKYRRRSEDERPALIIGDLRLELVWVVIPLLISMVIFYWGTTLYFKLMRPPANALEVFVVGKQWMWKVQHPDGRREINELHVPLGYPVKLTMTSEDVIHSFFVPAFRSKMDVLPGRYTSTWFEATKSGIYHLFCAEYCGSKHSGMIGSVNVMAPAQYEAWLNSTSGSIQSMASRGRQVYEKMRCHTCHDKGAVTMRGPELANLWGKRVLLSDGREVVADEAYIRESILKPEAKIVEGYQPLMPTFQNTIGEEEILEIISYIKSLGSNEKADATSS